MKVLILAAVLVGLSSAAPAATQAEIDADKPIIQEMVTVLKDQTKTPAEKQTAFTNAINSLQGPYKDEYNALVEKIKTAVNEIQSPTAKAAAQQFIELWESGALFGPKDQVKQQFSSIFGQLSDEDKQTLHSLHKQFGEEFKSTFKDIMPAHLQKEQDD